MKEMKERKYSCCRHEPAVNLSYLVNLNLIKIKKKKMKERKKNDISNNIHFGDFK